MDVKKIVALSIAFSFIFSISAFALGVTSPLPKDMKLLRGESSNFEFEIQAITSSNDLLCSYSMTEISPLIITFYSDEVTVTAGTVQKVYGTITVPSDAPFDSYSSELTVSCGAATSGEGGSQVRTTIGGTTLAIDVVEFREEEKKTAVAPQQMPVAELVLLAIIIIIILGAYSAYKKKSAKKAVARKRPRKTKK